MLRRIEVCSRNQEIDEDRGIFKDMLARNIGPGGAVRITSLAFVIVSKPCERRHGLGG